MPPTSVKRFAEPKVLVIDGLIAAGKTQLLRTLQEELTAKGLRVVCIYEPVEEWRELITLVSQDPKRYAYHFQTRVLHDRSVAVASSLRDAPLRDTDVDIYILERSIYSDILFVKMLSNRGWMTPFEVDSYMRQWHTWDELNPLVPDLCVWLNPDIATCMSRYRQRNREGEDVSEDYQQELWQQHRDMYSQGEMMIGNKRVVLHIYNCNFDFKDNAEGRKTAANEIYQLLINIDE